MWIKQEPNKLELWNKLHFEEKKTESIYHGSQYLWNTLSKTATRIKTTNALINKRANTIPLYFLQIQPMK